MVHFTSSNGYTGSAPNLVLSPRDINPRFVNIRTFNSPEKIKEDGQKLEHTVVLKIPFEILLRLF